MENTSMYCKCTVTWNSGRQDVFQDKLSKDGKPPKKFSDKVRAHKNFPTVKDVKVERF